MASFLGRVLRHLAALVVACLIFVMLGFAVLIGIGIASGGDEVKVSEGSVLVLDLDLRITDAPPRGTPSLAALATGPRDRRTELSTLVAELDRAAADPRIRAVFVTGQPQTEGLASSLPALREVAAALRRVKAQKPVLAYSEYLTQRQLLVLGEASELMLHPLGEVQWQGLASTRIYLKDFLDRYGVRVTTTSMGRYKTAAEMFVRNEMSEAEREQSGLFLDSAWQDIVADIATARGVDPATLQELVTRQPALSPDEARQAGLISGVAEYDAVLERLKKLAEWDTDAKTFAQISYEQYQQDGASRRALDLAGSKASRIAVVYVEGELANREGAGIANGNRISRELRKARLDDDIKAVVLRVNSPGGGVVASDLIRREVELAAQDKPVVVSMGGYAASGGYWVAMGGNVIFADATTLTGSIGVVKMFLQLDGTLDRFGISMDTVKTGEWANYPAGDRELTPEEKMFFERDAVAAYDDFLTRVANGRRMDRARVEELAGGRIYDGRTAMELGLVDRLGTLQDAVRHAAELAGVAEDFRAVHGPEPKPMDVFIEGLLRSLEGDEPMAARLGRGSEIQRVMDRATAILAPLQALDDPRDLYARLPFDIVAP